MKFTLFADNEDATKEDTEIGINKSSKLDLLRNLNYFLFLRFRF